MHWFFFTGEGQTYSKLAILSQTYTTLIVKQINATKRYIEAVAYRYIKWGLISKLYDERVLMETTDSALILPLVLLSKLSCLNRSYSAIDNFP